MVLKPRKTRKFSPSRVLRYTVARSYIHVRKLYYRIYTYYVFNSAWYLNPRCVIIIIHAGQNPGFSKKKSGHRDIACISGIITENPGWLAGMRRRKTFEKRGRPGLKYHVG